MKLMKTTLSILSIALTATMFAAGPILPEHQVFATGTPCNHLKSCYPNDLRGVAYGPCFQKEGKLLWSYTWCVKPGFKGGY
jgi:hypothetical protein